MPFAKHPRQNRNVSAIQSQAVVLHTGFRLFETHSERANVPQNDANLQMAGVRWKRDQEIAWLNKRTLCIHGTQRLPCRKNLEDAAAGASQKRDLQTSMGAIAENDVGVGSCLSAETHSTQS